MSTRWTERQTRRVQLEQAPRRRKRDADLIMLLICYLLLLIGSLVALAYEAGF